MIMFENEKYACVSCIKGHRSSTCKHTQRMLVKVRSRGRPKPAGVRKVIIVDKSSQSNIPVAIPDFPIDNTHGFALSSILNTASSPGTPTSSSSNKSKDTLPSADAAAAAADNNISSVSENMIKIEQTYDDSNKNNNENSNEETNSVNNKDTVETKKSCCGGQSKKKINSPVSSTPSPMGQTQTDFIDQDHFDKKKNGPTKCPGMNHQPILFLRAKKESKGVLVDGQLVLQEPTTETAKEQPINPHSVNTQKTNNNNHNHSNTSLKEITPKEQNFVEMFTQEGLYLSTSCSCDDKCQCPNCLIHRKDDELDQYIKKHSTVPLLNIGLAEIESDHNKMMNGSSPHNSTSSVNLFEDSRVQGFQQASSFPEIMMEQWNGNSDLKKTNEAVCKFKDTECVQIHCFKHTFHIISMNYILWNGLMSTKLTRKTGIKFKNKIIPSKHWWDFLVLQIPHMVAKNFKDFDQFDIITWFNNILEFHATELITDVGNYEANINSLEQYWMLFNQ